MKTVKVIWSAATSLIVIAAVIMALILAAARLTGVQVFTVLSGSMEPTYHVGSLIFVKEVEPADVQIGDPITFVLNENLLVATHRVIDISIDETGAIRYATKGDANNVPDGGLVHQNNLIGTPVFSIPVMGYVVSYIQHPSGT